MKNNIVILPTEDTTIVGKDNRAESFPKLQLTPPSGKVSYDHMTDTREGHRQNFHLYELSDEEIKDGDWVMDFWAIEEERRLYEWNSQEQGTVAATGCKKVISSTDKTLGECQGCRFNKNSGDVYYTCSCNKVPLMNEEVIIDFIKSYNND